MIALAAVFMLAAVAAVSLIPSASAADEFSTYSDIRAETYTGGVGKTMEYKIYAAGDTAGDINFAAKLTDSGGNTVSRVYPTSGRVDIGGTSLSVTVPDSAGTYTLVVDFTYTGTGEDTKTVTKTAPLIAVVPVKLSATLVNNGDTVTDMKVWFIVDGNVIEKSEQDVSILPNSSQDVTYEWITEGLSGGRHTVTLSGEVGPIREKVEGLDVPTNFYVGQTSYKLTEALMVFVLIVLFIILLVIIRKPVKNVGKPKGRR